MREHEQTVKDLLSQGHAFVPINIDLVESAESAARIFLLAQSENWRDWHFERKDNTKLGIVEEFSSHAGTSQERQLALSFAHDLSRKRPAHDPHDKACLGAVTELYRDMRRRVSDLSFELDRHCGINDINGRIRSTFELGDERATSLQLCSGVFGRRSINNTFQADSVLSIFFSNENSEIWLKDETKDKWSLRSPPYGSALLFFGLNVTKLENPAFRPSMYRIDAQGGKALRGTIMHVQIKEVVLAGDSPTNVEPLVA